MWIKCTNPATRRLYDKNISTEPVEFSENGTTQVSKSVGKALVRKYDAIEEYQAETDSEDDESDE